VPEDPDNAPLPPLGPRPARGDGLPSLAPRPASSRSGLPPIPPAGDPASPAQDPPQSPRPGRATSIGRAPREPREPREPSARRGLVAVVAAAVLAGAVAGAATTYVLGDPRASAPSAQVNAGAEVPAESLQDAIAAVDGSVVQVRSRGGLGSGVVTAEKGLIISNEHVVGGQGNEVMVITADDRRVPATVVASDADKDLAVLRPKGDVGQGVQIAPEPDGALRPGDQVFAIGSPFGLRGTVTVGVVSAVNRRGDNGTPMIQTDAPINPGNSGGGLFDLRGRLVGVPTSINSPVPGNVGIGFAVTADQVRRALEDVK